MSLDPVKLNDLRRRVLEGKEWTREELTSAIRKMVGERVNQIEMPKAKGKSTKKSNVDLNDLLG